MRPRRSRDVACRLLRARDVETARHRVPALVLGLAALGLAGAEAGGLAWQRSSPDGGAGEAAALAGDAAGRLAAADERGLWLRGEEGWRRLAVRGPVADLAFDGQGVLWIAGEYGLLRLAADGRLETVSLAPGERGRLVRRLAAAGGLLAAAGEGGAFVSLGGGSWEPVQEGVPSGPVDVVALRSLPLAEPTFELWLSVRGVLYRAQVRRRGSGLELESARAVPLEGRGARQPAVDIAAGSASDPVLVLGSDWLAWGVWPEVPWPSRPLALPPGTAARRLARFADRLWLATDRGLFEAGDPAGPWKRAADPLGGLATAALAAAGGAFYAASEAGIFAGSPRASAADVAPNGVVHWWPRPGEPSVQTVHRAALAYLDLGPARMRDLRRRVDRRGWLPLVDLRASGALERGRSKAFDETFTSGALHQLFDEGIDRGHDAGVSLTLSWDLGDAVYHPEALDVSKEAREVIELRDDILDEITRLYFERRRVLAGLAAAASDAGEEAASLRLRADELAASLDAWTGGWFSLQALPLSGGPARPATQEKE